MCCFVKRQARSPMTRSHQTYLAVKQCYTPNGSPALTHFQSKVKSMFESSDPSGLYLSLVSVALHVSDLRIISTAPWMGC